MKQLAGGTSQVQTTVQEELLILPFDHRGSLLEKLLGVKGRDPTAEESRTVSELKRIVYDGFKLALQRGVPREKTAILVDEQFCSAIIADARKQGLTFAVSVEKSGQEVFDFEYADWRDRIVATNPTYAKVLVRLNPEGDATANRMQLTRLKQLNDFLKQSHHGLLFELLVVATPEQLAAAGSKEVFDSAVRPRLMVRAMRQIQDVGIEPEVWKLEGVDRKEDADALVAQARAGGRTAGIITLGRGENKEKVTEWLKVGAKIKGIIGFAVGRTIFWDAIKGYHEKKLTRAAAVDAIARNYTEFVDLWLREKK